MDVITIGDAMVSFNPQSKGPLRYVNTFERKVGGAELNVAIGCSRLGLKTKWVSRLGNDEFGRYIYNFSRGEGLDMSHVELVEGYPTSVHFKEILEDGGGRTFYYRSNSPTTALTGSDINQSLFADAKLFHLTGVFPAVDQEKNVDLIKQAIGLAKQEGMLISFDPNIRLKLWSKPEAKKALKSFLPDVDILLTGIDEAEILFETKDPDAIIAECRKLDITYVAIKQGEEGSIGYFNGEKITAPSVKPRKVVDTVGAGDGFDAGFIYGVLQGWTLDKILLFANTIGSMVVSVSGDNEGLPYLEDILIQMGEREFIER
ncbi:sugar kinase [Jeotgalibacillus sp. S-D1]|uniref:sugar kinase n=1 Tax=Jeotgalibacillus sp. S-D1 TaxID=2552189 RepID=UPI001059F4DE|nr:sugar kinase [Jeotgalibacillus sp. S-D1]TDL30896.1 sugar kinase [Jeotgalibacillus sp. S-D1]